MQEIFRSFVRRPHLVLFVLAFALTALAAAADDGARYAPALDTKVVIAVGEYGDAPDGTSALYSAPVASVTGNFPTRYSTANSRYSLPGGHTLSKDTYLGQVVSLEQGARDALDPDLVENLVDDDFDDGLINGLCPLPASITAPFDVDLVIEVTLDANATAGTRYVNVLVDSDQNGVWNDQLASEWVIRDYPLTNLVPGTTTQVTIGSFPLSGSLAGMWMRIAVTDQKVVDVVPVDITGWDGSGTFDEGEIEDYLVRDALFLLSQAASAAAEADASAAAIEAEYDRVKDKEVGVATACAEMLTIVDQITVASASASARAYDSDQDSDAAAVQAGAAALACAEADAQAQAVASACARCGCATACAYSEASASAAAAACAGASASAAAAATATADAAASAWASARAIALAWAHAEAYAQACAQAKVTLQYELTAWALASSNARASADAAASAVNDVRLALCGGDGDAAVAAAAVARASAEATAQATADAFTEIRTYIDIDTETRTRVAWGWDTWGLIIEIEEASARARASASASASAAAQAEAIAVAAAASLAEAEASATASCSGSCVASVCTRAEVAVIAEVFTGTAVGAGADQWVEIYNPTAKPIDLSTWTLGQSGPGPDYTASLVPLAGVLGPGETFVVGGPMSDPTNGMPFYDMPFDFMPDLDPMNGGVALFDVPFDQVTSETVPVDAVVYGDDNVHGLIDETGQVNPPDVTAAPEGMSLERLDYDGVGWQVSPEPTANVTPLTAIAGGC